MKKFFLLFLLIPLHHVLCAQEEIVTNNQVIESRPEQFQKTDYAHFRIAVAGGYSNRFATTKEDSDRKLNNGYHYGMELNGFFNETFGMGINYYAGRFRAKDDHPERVTIQQVIPTFSVRIFDEKQRGGILINLGVGYIDYTDKYRQDQGMGLLLSVGYDIAFSRTMAACIQASGTSGKLSDLKRSNNSNSPGGWGKVNLSLGLRFAK